MAYRRKGPGMKTRKGPKKYQRRKIQRRKQLRNKTTLPMGLGFPKKVVMTHRYTDMLALTCTSGVLQSYKFACNGMYDPDITGTGHQPMYFDQMTAIYNHYTVIGSKISYRVVPNAAWTNPAFVGCYINDDNSGTPSGISTVSEYSSGIVKPIAVGATNPTLITRKWSAKKTFGGSVLGNNTLLGTAAANPTELSVYDFCFQTTNNATASINIEVFIDYIVVWDELKDLSAS